MKKNTIHFEDFKEIMTLNTIIPFLKENDVKFKQKSLVKGSDIDVVIVDNKELEKVTRGIGYGQGKHKLYYPRNPIDGVELILLYNYFGWQGNYEPDSVTNHLSIFKSGEELKNDMVPESFKEITLLDEDATSIIQFEKEIKNIFGITTIKATKYKCIEEFIEINPKLFNKYFALIFNGKSLFVDINFILEKLSIDDRIEGLNTIRNFHEVTDNANEYEDFDKNIKLFLKKLNSKLVQKERSFNLRDVMSFYEYYEDELDIDLFGFNYDGLVKYNQIKTYFFICVDCDNEKIGIVSRLHEKYLKFINENS